ncbi:hypothetical protein ACFT7S_00850 [Streptomyces sp. NPDC057136]
MTHHADSPLLPADAASPAGKRGADGVIGFLMELAQGRSSATHFVGLT